MESDWRRGGKREIAVRKAEAALEIFADPEGIFGGSMRVMPSLMRRAKASATISVRVAGHGAGVAEQRSMYRGRPRGEVRAFGGFDEHRKSAAIFSSSSWGPRRGGNLPRAGRGRGFSGVGEEAGFFAFLESF